MNEFLGKELTVKDFLRWGQHAIPRPNSGHFWVDGIYLAMISVLQFSVVQGITDPTYISIDVITPWAAVLAIYQKPLQGLVLLILAALGMEMHTALPAGTYLTTYYIMFGCVLLLRPNISWRQPSPWVLTVASAQLVTGIFEIAVLVFTETPAVLYVEHFVTRICRVAVSAVVAIVLARSMVRRLSLVGAR